MAPDNTYPHTNITNGMVWCWPTIWIYLARVKNNHLITISEVPKIFTIPSARDVGEAPEEAVCIILADRPSNPCYILLLPLWILEATEMGETVVLLEDDGGIVQCKPHHQIGIRETNSWARSIMVKNLSLLPLPSWWPTEYFHQCPMTALDATNHHGKQSEWSLVD